MKQSAYNFKVKLADGNTGIFNTYKNSLIVLNDTELEHLCNLSLASKDELKVFKDLDLIVEDNIDEFKIMTEDTLKYANDDRVNVRILTTMDCMANCVYCYENRSDLKMSRETADNVVEFLRNLTKDKIHIEWFGGEPLYNSDIISYICNKLYEYGIEFTSSMVTNGILATDEIVNQFENWKINKIQITLDGVEKIYEKVKRVPEGTFNTVIENIKRIINKKIDVNIRMNYMHNMDALKELLDYMYDVIGPHEYLHYYAYPVFELCNSDKEFDFRIADKIIELNEYIISKGLGKADRLFSIRYKGMGCFATHKNGYTIGPDGNLYGCSHICNLPIGDVVNGPNEKRNMFLADIPTRCEYCILYPVCKGGCKVAELGLDKINQCNQYKNSFDEFVRRMIFYKMNKKEE